MKRFPCVSRTFFFSTLGLRNATPAQIDTLMDRIDINGKVAVWCLMMVEGPMINQLFVCDGFQQGTVCWIILNLWMLPWSVAKPNGGAKVGREGRPERAVGAGTGKRNVSCCVYCVLDQVTQWGFTHTDFSDFLPGVRQWPFHVPDPADRGWVRL